MEPAYLRLSEKEWKEKIGLADEMPSKCVLCGHLCEVDRGSRKKGVCGEGSFARVAAFLPHMGEEPPISGKRGSGCIFFAGCVLRCVFCQNFQISQKGLGREVEDEELASIMLSLQKRGCHNINLVSPTPHVPSIIRAVWLASKRGLVIPLVYNTGGYDSEETLRLLDRIVDIYLPDAKYADNRRARRLSSAPRYSEVMQRGLVEMKRQVGDLKIAENGIAQRGLLVRHLVLPGALPESFEVMTFVAEFLSRKTWLSLMSQYSPFYRALEFPEISRPLTLEEVATVTSWIDLLGLENCFIQEPESKDAWVPDFKKEIPFVEASFPFLDHGPP